jgi:hypothetical protein
MTQISLRFRKSMRSAPRLLGLAVAGACFAMAGLAEAGTTARAALVSPRYQAKTARSGLGMTLHTGEAASQPAAGRKNAPSSRLTRYHDFSFQYQLSFQISNTSTSVVQTKWNRSPNRTPRRVISNLSGTGTPTPLQNQQADSTSGDERRLLQLGLAFAVLYVVFLVFWFWATREGRRRFEGATRF